MLQLRTTDYLLWLGNIRLLGVSHYGQVWEVLMLEYYRINGWIYLLHYGSG